MPWSLFLCRGNTLYHCVQKQVLLTSIWQAVVNTKKSKCTFLLKLNFPHSFEVLPGLGLAPSAAVLSVTLALVIVCLEKLLCNLKYFVG